ncbi:MAG: hypothetical protein AABM43_07880 [Actinomycetota bacterium]
MSEAEGAFEDVGFNTQLAGAARWIAAEVERLPEGDRPDIAEDWSALLDALEDARSLAAKQLEVDAWRLHMRKRLAKVPST